MIAKDELRSFVERIERLEEEKAGIAEDIRSVYGEAKGNGFDVKALRSIIKLRKMDASERQEQQAILETYMHALGMLADTELGQAAIKRDLGDDCNLTISSGGKSAEMKLSTFTTIADAAKTATGRAALRKAIDAVKNDDLPAGVPTPPAGQSQPAAHVLPDTTNGAAGEARPHDNSDGLDIPPWLARGEKFAPRKDQAT